MSKLPRYYLEHDKKADDWKLVNAANRVVDRFETKANGTAGGVLSGAIGEGGGSVRIRLMDGSIQEERTFPRSADPKKSPG